MILTHIMHKSPNIAFSLDKLTEVKSIHPGAGIWIFMMFVFSLVFNVEFANTLDIDLTYFYILFGLVAFYLTYFSINFYDEDILNKVAFRIASRKKSFGFCAFLKLSFFIFLLPIFLVALLKYFYLFFK